MKKFQLFAVGVFAILLSVNLAHASKNWDWNWFWSVSDERVLAVSPDEVRTVEGGELVMRVETDAYAGISTVSVIRDEQGALSALVYLSRTDGDKTITLEQLRKAPAVLKQSDGRSVVSLAIERDFTAEKGGHAYIRFLESGISGTYRNFRVLLDVQDKVILRSDPNPKDPESDRNRYTSTFNHLFMKKNTFFGKLIGIESITPSMKR